MIRATTSKGLRQAIGNQWSPIETMAWSPSTYGLIISVMAVAGGQLLFKHAANLAHAAGSLTSPKVIFVLGLAISIYGLATLLWVWALQFIPLNRAYPLMALSFMIVPLGSWYFFEETITFGYGVGVLMLLLGLIIISQSMGS